MSEQNEAIAAIEKAFESNPQLKEKILDLQRRAVDEGWTPEEHGEKVGELLTANDLEVTPKDLLEMTKDSGAELTDAELEQVAGGSWNEKSCNKTKICESGTSRSCYPHC